MKLIVGIVVLLLGLTWARWQVKRYRSRPVEAIAEDALDIIVDFLPSFLCILFTIYLGIALVHAHFTGN